VAFLEHFLLQLRVLAKAQLSRYPPRSPPRTRRHDHQKPFTVPAWNARALAESGWLTKTTRRARKKTAPACTVAALTSLQHASMLSRSGTRLPMQNPFHVLLLPTFIRLRCPTLHQLVHRPMAPAKVPWRPWWRKTRSRKRQSLRKG
jgi:hypothetical protein